MIYNNPKKTEWGTILSRPNINDNKNIYEIVIPTLKEIKERGNTAIIEYINKFNNYNIKQDDFLVSEAEITESIKRVDKDIKNAISLAYMNISKFHKGQIKEDINIETTPGVVCKQINKPIENVGIYIPGGTAPLFSTVLMLAIPAKLAGCKNISIITPCTQDGDIPDIIIYAANYCGINKIYKIGGIAAIGAMAYGTDTINKCDKIFGPGNNYVTVAKQIVSTSTCAIDMPAGPSEVMIMADSSCNPKYVAADVISQLEHGKDSQAIVITNELELAYNIKYEIQNQYESSVRKEYISESLKNSKIIVAADYQEFIELANLYAPEHLIISTTNYNDIVSKITNAGSIFLGNYSPESAGDYASGTNHTLPTGGWAKSYSGVGLSSFLKQITIQEISKKGLMNIGESIEQMAKAEGLLAHKNAVSIRLSEIKKEKNGRN